MRNPSPTVQVATKVVYAAFELLRENGGQMKVRDILAGVARRQRALQASARTRETGLCEVVRSSNRSAFAMS